MKYVLRALSVLVLGTALWAQGGDNPLCTQPTIQGQVDTTCNNFTSDCSNLDHGCTSVSFQASCSGNFDLDVWLDGPASSHDCKVCVKVKKQSSGQIVGSCTLDVCVEGTSTKTCAGGVHLEQGYGYNLYVCLTYCELRDNCNHCTSCKAHGCVRGNDQTAPCYP